ncbi:hypothetical protein ADIS_4116 [Lunatimonas lonarensis]|uniref:Calcineurin-like phosphoesterase domain-containing protein n=1 Tax=Lunatimonas lonarensis TaxID=1232681 RepID=R7ZMV5_9BACT|nr:metallophosphoesterase [Lunatimonas lonarensis]EON75412.1 hypothetical protein ADIS_4116 [Lunatimonas lonarensis]
MQRRSFFWLLFLGIALTIYSCKEKATEVQRVRFGLISDVHLPTMHDSEHRIQTFIDSMRLAKPDFLIELGDLVTPAPQYQPLFEIWENYPGERYSVIGNHEMDGGYGLEQVLEHRKLQQSYYHFEKNGFHFIVLDGNDKRTPEETGYREYIGPVQQEWLKSKLEALEGPIVIFSHQSIGPIGSMHNGAEIRQLLEAHNKDNERSRIVACFNGHLHYDDARQVNGIWYIHVNSAAYFWMGEEYAHIRYSEEVDRDFRWIKYTAPYRDPLFAVVEISSDGEISIHGKQSEYVGPSPWELGYPERNRESIRPAISDRKLRFDPL